MSILIDFKVTAWSRAKIAEPSASIVRKHIESHGISRHSLLYELCRDEDITWQALDDSEEMMSVDDNDGYSTIELFDEDGKKVWENGKDKDDE